MEKKEFVLTKEEYDLGIAMAKKIELKRIAKVIDKIIENRIKEIKKDQTNSQKNLKDGTK